MELFNLTPLAEGSIDGLYCEKPVQTNQAQPLLRTASILMRAVLVESYEI
jgi:hypothetical protein